MIKPLKFSPISFRNTTVLSKLWREGKLPTVTKGFYGGDLTIQNCSNEHIRPHSQGGATNIRNIALATDFNNNKRGNRPLSEFFNKEAFETYCEEFKGLQIPYKKGNKLKTFFGDNYVKQITQTVIEELTKEKRLDLLG